MPGPYAHLTAALEVAVKPVLSRIDAMPSRAVAALLRWVTYCELGAVCPDLPYMGLTDARSMHWSDLMHHQGSGAFLKAGIARLQSMTGDRRDKGAAWLMGFASHVVMDVAVHPVINLRVGPYEENKSRHRSCEMHQDVYIYQRLGLGPMHLAEHFRSVGGPARERFHRLSVDPDIETLWRDLLREVYPDAYQDRRPRIDYWFRWYRRAIDKVAEEATLLPFARHVGANLGLVYPTEDEVDSSFIVDLQTPNGNTASYDQVFDHAKAWLATVWGWIGSAIYDHDTRYLSRLTDWDLDTGLDPDGAMILWS